MEGCINPEPCTLRAPCRSILAGSEEDRALLPLDDEWEGEGAQLSSRKLEEHVFDAIYGSEAIYVNSLCGPPLGIDRFPRIHRR